jgi:hypothetical protein
VLLAPGTPYYASLQALPKAGERVLPAPVARVVRDVLASVVADGTARRLRGSFVAPGGAALVVGGKTPAPATTAASARMARRPPARPTTARPRSRFSSASVITG